MSDYVDSYDYEALVSFNKSPINKEMIKFLSAMTESIIKIKPTNNMIEIAKSAPPLYNFIKGICVKSSVRTSTLMATSVYLTKLKKIIPSNVYGIESTRHRIFMGCLILASKTLNDSSPMNKHWAKYSNGLLHLREINTIERELLEYFDWNLTITVKDLVNCLTHFLAPIRKNLISESQASQSLEFINSTLTSLPTTPMTTLYTGANSTELASCSSSCSDYSVPSLIASTTSSSSSSNYAANSINAKTLEKTLSDEFDFSIDFDIDNVLLMDEHFATLDQLDYGKTRNNNNANVLQTPTFSNTRKSSLKKSNWQAFF